MPMFRSTYGGIYTVTGAPVVLNDLSSQISGSVLGLLIAALVVMAATLLIVFRSRLRLLPLAIALAAAGITFGALSLVGGSLTMASIAVLPILIGLAVDYAVQFQSRVQEARSADGHRARGDRPGGGRGRTDDRGRGARDGDRVPRSAPLAGADGPWLRPAARGRDRGRASLCADRRLGGARARRAPRPHRALSRRRERSARPSAAPVRSCGDAGAGHQPAAPGIHARGASTQVA